MELEIKIDIQKRFMDAIRDYCSANQIDVSEYIANCLIKEINIIRYGDLNEKIYGKEKTDIKQEEDVNIYDVKIENNKENISDNIVTIDKVKEEAPKVTKRRRTIKSK